MEIIYQLERRYQFGTLLAIICLVTVLRPSSFSVDASSAVVTVKGPNPQIQLVEQPPLKSYLLRNSPLYLNCRAIRTQVISHHNNNDDDDDNNEDDDGLSNIDDDIDDEIDNEFNENSRSLLSSSSYEKKLIKHRLNGFTYSWYHNNKKILQKSEIGYTIFSNGTLKIEYAESAVGNYHCLVNASKINLGVLLSTSVSVELPRLEKIDIPIVNQIAPYGSFYTINCPFHSHPLANIIWSIDNKFLNKDTNDPKIIYLNNGSLLLLNGELINNTRITCIAENTLLNIKRNYSTTLIIRDEISIKPNYGLFPPLQEYVYVVRIGNPIRLLCMSYLNEPVAWYYSTKLNGTFQKLASSNEWKRQHANYQRDNGYYKCSTINNDTQVYQVIVEIPPNFNLSVSSVESSIGARVSLNCSATGNPLPSIKWFHNGKQILNDIIISYKRPLLRIYTLELSDAGIYQCFAENSAGQNVSTGLLTVRRYDTVVAPKEVKCYPKNSTSVVITFEMDDYISQLTYYMGNKNPHSFYLNVHSLELNRRSFELTPNEYKLKLFTLYLRGLIESGAHRTVNTDSNTNSIMTMSNLSKGVLCSTQGLPVYSITNPSGIFIWWPLRELNVNTSYITVQMKINNKSGSFAETMIGYKQLIHEHHTWNDVSKGLVPINVIEIKEIENSDEKSYTEINLPSDVSGILIPNTDTVLARVVVPIINHDTEKEIKMDLKYLEWHTIHRITNETKMIKIIKISSRNIDFKVLSFDIDCIKICYQQISTGSLFKSNLNCIEKNLQGHIFTLDSLNPDSRYRMDVFSCFYDNIIERFEFKTMKGVPGPVKGVKLIREDGVAIKWDEPRNIYGELLGFNIKWILHNKSYDVNVSSETRYFQFPSATPIDKINITIFVIGSTGRGIPVYINPPVLNQLIKEENSDKTLGIIIGIILSIIIIVIFTYVVVKNRSCIKGRDNSDQSRGAPQMPPIYEMQTLLSTNQIVKTTPNGITQSVINSNFVTDKTTEADKSSSNGFHSIEGDQIHSSNGSQREIRNRNHDEHEMATKNISSEEYCSDSIESLSDSYNEPFISNGNYPKHLDSPKLMNTHTTPSFNFGTKYLGGKKCGASVRETCDYRRPIIGPNG